MLYGSKLILENYYVTRSAWMPAETGYAAFD